MADFQLREAIQVLERTPRTLLAQLGGLDDAWLDERNEGPESFSPRDVLGHLISGERLDWMQRVMTILEHGESKPFHPFDRFAFRETAPEYLAGMLATFTELRSRNLADLRALNLTPEQLDKTGTHPTFGRVTLRQLLATWVVHDLSHLAQVERVMAKRYAHAVGPWREFLPILDRGPTPRA